MEDPEHLALDPSELSRTREHLEFLARLFAQIKPFEVRGKLVAELLAPGLDRKIPLCLSNFRLAGIAILSQQVTSKPG